jgi:hypothetical protein
MKNRAVSRRILGWVAVPLLYRVPSRDFIRYSTTSEPAVLETAKVRRMVCLRSKRLSIV